MADVRRFVNGRLVASGGAAEAAEQEAPSLAALVASRPFLVISVSNCPQCEELAAFLDGRGVPSTVFVKWDKAASEYQGLKKQLQAHAGEVFTFPQVFAQGAHQGGLHEVVAKAEAGAFDDLFEREFGAEPVTLQRKIQRQSMVVFSLPNCPQCDELYADLQRRGVPVQDVFVKLDKAQPEYASFKAQLQRLMGKERFSFPQTFVEGVYQGDYDEVITKADQGGFDAFFEQRFGIQPLLAKLPPQPEIGAAIAFDEDF